MHALRQKWAMMKTYQRVQRLWTDYQTVSDKTDVKEAHKRLLVFLDSFQSAYQEWGLQEGASLSLDKLYGDCTEILLSILETIEKETNEHQQTGGRSSKDNLELLAALINKALNVAELIMKDEKYRRLVASTPNLINSILSMLETLNTTETKKLALRIISTMADTTAIKVEIGRHEGFKKILRLLIEGDAELTQEILRTFKHLADSRGGDLEQPTTTSPSSSATPPPPSSLPAGGSSASFLNGIMGGLWSDVGSLVSDVSRYLNVNGSERGLQVRLNEEGNVAGAESALVPSKADVEAAIASFKEKYEAPSSPPPQPASTLPSVVPVVVVAPPTPSLKDNDMDDAASKDETALKDFMRIQGALTTLTSVLSANALTYDGKLDIVVTISRLLLQSDENQKEFRRMDGYSILQQLFDKVIWEPVEESRVFVQDCFNLIFTIALDGNKDMSVGNMDVLTLVVFLATSSSHIEVRRQGLLCIQDLLSLYPTNAVFLRETGGITLLLSKVTAIVLSNSANPEAEGDQEEMNYLQMLLHLLTYAAVILSNHNTEIFQAFVGIVTRTSASPSLSSRLLMQSLARLLMDYKRRSVVLKGQFLSPVIKTLVDAPTSGVLLLQIMELLIECEHATMDQFDQAEGFSTLLACIGSANESASTSQTAEMALWLIQDLVSARPENLPYFKWLVEILRGMREQVLNSSRKPDKAGQWSIGGDEPTKAERGQHVLSSLPAWLGIKVMHVLSDLLFHSQHGANFKSLLRTIGGLEALLDLVRFSDDLELATAAMQTLRDGLVGCEPNKSYLINAVGYTDFVRSLLSSSCSKNMDMYLLVIDVAIAGDIDSALSPKQATRQETFHLSSDLQATIQELISPQLLFAEPLKLSKSRQTSLALYVEPNTELDPKQQLLKPGTPTGSGGGGGGQGGSLKAGHARQPSQSSSRRVGHSRQGSTSSSGGWLSQPLSVTAALNSMGVTAASSAPDMLAVASSTADTESISSSSYRPTPSLTRMAPGTPDSSSMSSSVELVSIEGSSKLAQREAASAPEHTLDLSLLKSLSLRDSQAGLAILNLHRMLEEDAADRKNLGMVISYLLRGNPKNYRLLSHCEGLAACLLVLAFKEAFALNSEYPTTESSQLNLHAEVTSSSSIASANDLKLVLSETGLLYLDILEQLMVYDMKESDARLLIEFAIDPAAVLVEARAASLKKALKLSIDGRSTELVANVVVSLQAHAADILAQIAQRSDPRSYLYFDGLHASVSKQFSHFVSSKTGFTFACWCKLPSDWRQSGSPGADQCILSFTDATARPCLLLTLRRIGADKYQFKNDSLCFAVRSQAYPAPPEDFVFDAMSVSMEDGRWHCVALSHRKKATVLYVDGLLVQRATWLTYDKPGMSHRSYRVVIGAQPESPGASRPSTEDSIAKAHDDADTLYSNHFCGLLTNIHFTEGVWELPAAEKFFLASASYANSISKLGIDSREFSSLLPHIYTDVDPSMADSGWILVDSLANDSQAMPQSAPPVMEGSAPVAVRESWLHPDQRFTLEGSTQVHLTAGLADHLQHVGGVARLMKLLSQGVSPSSSWVEGFRILFYTLKNHPRNIKEFENLKGYTVLYHLLLPRGSEIPAAVFDVLMDFAVDTGVQRALRHPQAITLMLDLVIVATDHAQKHFLRSLIHINDHYDFLPRLKDVFNASIVFEIISHLPDKLKPTMLKLLDRLIPWLSVDDIGMLFAFITHEKRQYVELKAEICDVILRHMERTPAVADNVNSVCDTSLLISFLDMPSERMRLSFLKMIGVLLAQSPVVGRAMMTKIAGFDAIWLFLAPFPVTADLCDVLLRIAFTSPAPSSANSSPSKKGSPSPSPPTARQTDVLDLTFPEALRLLLELLKSCPQDNLAFAVLSDIKRALSASNMELLWEHPWADWIDVFVKDRRAMSVTNNSSNSSLNHLGIASEPSPSSDHLQSPQQQQQQQQQQKEEMSSVQTVLDSIVQKMLFYDLGRKNGVIARNKGLVMEDDSFFLHMVHCLLDFLGTQPILAADKATDFVRNLYTLLRYIDKEIPFDAPVYQHFISVANLMVMQNNSNVRSSMRVCGLLDLRDDLVVQMLYTETPSGCADFLRSFSFELVADQPKFRDSHGTLFILRHFLKASQDRVLQGAIGRVLSTVFLPIDENRRAIAKVVEDPEFMLRLVNNPSSEEDFFAWFYASGPDATLKRTTIEARVEAKVLPLLAVQRRDQDKANLRRSKRQKLVRERQVRQSSVTNKLLGEVKTKGRARLAKLAALHQQHQEQLLAKRQERIRVGEEQWTLLQK